METHEHQWVSTGTPLHTSCLDEYLVCVLCGKTQEIEWHSSTPSFKKGKSAIPHQCRFGEYNELNAINIMLLKCTICGRKKARQNNLPQPQQQTMLPQILSPTPKSTIWNLNPFFQVSGDLNY